ncbi:MAG: hypothetical protein L6R41_002633 [Letrouitia leprolyta]|nr:MAG: hypothetical protein L6R41_002633 [Letrouitia leprolyta]
MSQFSLRSLFSLFLLISLISAQEAQEACKRDNIYRALKRQTSGIGDSFCTELLQKVSYIGTLDPTVTIPVYTTSTDINSLDPVYTYKSKGTKTKITSTSYASQTRTANPTKFTVPLPSYVEQYPTSKVSSACSCLITAIPTYTQYRRCDGVLSSTATYFTTLTYTTGKPNGKTITFTYTDTTTKYKSLPPPILPPAPRPTASTTSQPINHSGTALAMLP